MFRRSLSERVWLQAEAASEQLGARSLCTQQLADLNKRLPPESCLPSAKPVGRPARYERQLAVRPSTPHTITLQPSSFRNLRLPKRLRVIYFLARTRLAQRLIMVPITPALPCKGQHSDPKGFGSTAEPFFLSSLTSNSWPACWGSSARISRGRAISRGTQDRDSPG